MIALQVVEGSNHEGAWCSLAEPLVSTTMLVSSSKLLLNWLGSIYC